jgi:hypothetical protein
MERSHPVRATAASPTRRLEGRRWPWVIVIAGGLVAKGAAIASLTHHRASWIALLALLSLTAFLRGAPFALALCVAPLLAVVVDPHPWFLGVAVGFGAFFVLLGLFLAIGTVLNLRDTRKR